MTAFLTTIRERVALSHSSWRSLDARALVPDTLTKVTRCSTLPAGTRYCASAALGSVDGFWAR